MSPIELQLAEASKRAITRLKKQGLSLNETYNYSPPSLPDDVTSMGDENLMDLYAKYVAYLEFINLQVWCAHTDKAEADTEMVVERARKKLAMKADGKAVALIDSEVELNDVYREKVNKYQELSNYHSLIQLMSDKLSKDISFINREITRRVNLNKVVGRAPWLTP